jgi:membrane protease YdiL (CAAX protease family)
MNLLSFLAIFILPILLIIMGEYFSLFSLKNISNYRLKVSLYACIGLVISVIILSINSLEFKKLNVPAMVIGDFTSFIWGLIFGLTISLSSGVIYGLINHHPMRMGKLFNNFDTKLLSNLYPAFTEEIYFRGGIVHLISHLFHSNWGLVIGSVPFGVIHVIRVLFGKKVTFSQILGISLAGLMLSLMYFRFGLIAAIVSHLMWNAIVLGWGQVYQIDNKHLENNIEGSWSTCLILFIASLTLFISP